MSGRNPYPIDDIRWAEHEYINRKPRMVKRVDRTKLAANASFDTESPALNASCNMVSDWLWPRMQGFVAGSFFTVGAAWVWSWFL